mmetsp:Transcript_40635/g.85058  ORF Transcript_40635/g.85058 Transcript_40635/m.85058 type:complete len:90 (-) Transcript_40635:845-1114(-)
MTHWTSDFSNWIWCFIKVLSTCEYFASNFDHFVHKPYWMLDIAQTLHAHTFQIPRLPTIFFPQSTSILVVGETCAFQSILADPSTKQPQ